MVFRLSMAGNFGSYMVYADESGDHSLDQVNPTFPVFVMSFCVFNKEDYVQVVEPAFQRLKFKFFGHDLVVFHEREMRKATGPFAFLQVPQEREEFYNDLNKVMQDAPFTLISAVINKTALKKAYTTPAHPYHMAVHFCMERLYLHMKGLGQGSKLTHVVFEARGKKEDAELELEFRRTCATNMTGNKLCLEPVFAPKTINSTGLQFADLISRPIGRHVMNPDQTNRAYDIFSTKFRKNPANGKVEGWGLKIFP